MGGGRGRGTRGHDGKEGRKGKVTGAMVDGNGAIYCHQNKQTQPIFQVSFDVSFEGGMSHLRLCLLRPEFAAMPGADACQNRSAGADIAQEEWH